VPATTRSPSPRPTGRDPPVIIDSSMSAAPSTTSPSAGTRPPGRTSTKSPGSSADTGTVSTAPSRTRSASSGSSSASACNAPRAWPTARISSQWPSSMITISAASSHQNSRSSSPSTVAELATKATEIASAISVIIPGWRARSSDTAPARNGRPP
jgi:hypothetical protein